MRRPTDDAIRAHLAHQAGLTFSYRDVGATRDTVHLSPRHLSARFVVDHYRLRLGAGGETFRRARQALLSWRMFAVGWVELLWPAVPVEEGATVGILVRRLGLWSLNACRVVYLVEERGDIERFGFANGTLPDHAARGEERFLVEHHHHDDSVWFDLLAFSRPNQVLARLGYPYVRRLQRRFAAASQDAMAYATG